MGKYVVLGALLGLGLSACTEASPQLRARIVARYQAKLAREAQLKSSLPPSYSSLTAKRAKKLKALEPKRKKPKPSASLMLDESLLAKLESVDRPLLVSTTARAKAEGANAKPSKPAAPLPEASLLEAAGFFAASISDQTVVATWMEDGKAKTLTYAELKEARKSAFVKMMQQQYETTKRELDQHLVERLLNAEAKRQKTTVDAMMGKLASAITEAEVKSFYEQNVARGGKGPPLEKVSDRIRSYLAMTNQVAKLKAAAGVKLSVPEPPGVEFDLTGRPSVGAKSPKVTIVEFSDFQCPYCARASEPVKKLIEAFPDQVAVYFLHFPLSFHQQAMPAAMASKCAQDQGKFWPMHDKIFGAQSTMALTDLEKHAQAIELDMKAYGACMQDPKTAAYVQADMAQGSNAGVSGTPAFFVNGRATQGPPSLEDIRSLLEG